MSAIAIGWSETYNERARPVHANDDTPDSLNACGHTASPIAPCWCPAWAAAIALNMERGHWLASGSTTLTSFANFLIMLLHGRVSSFTVRYQLMGALVRIKGLSVAAFSVDLVYSGVADPWHARMLK